MQIGFETIGNATLICYDKKPILVTDPWISGNAYFESWGLSHEIPEAQMEAIHSAEYIWISHGHPDHLSPASLKLLCGKTILLPNHVGDRIFDGLKGDGYDVHKLQDRTWVKLSAHIQVLCISDYNQDAILLISLNDRLVVDTNDAYDRGWGTFVRKTVRQFETSFLLSLTGYGDAGMINYFDEQGNRIPPFALKKIPFGKKIAHQAESFGVSYFIPFSSMHRYQRKDSIWANECTTGVEDHAKGFESESCQILPAYIQFDCVRDTWERLNPPERKLEILDPETIGDSWDEPLDKGDMISVNRYFHAIDHLKKTVGFITLRVASEEHRVELNRKRFSKGITFEVPRNSLMLAVKHEIFDDLLIGNFMKTTLHGDWRTRHLGPDFEPHVPKYADNGKAKSDGELRHYFREYRKRAMFEYLRHSLEQSSINLLRPLVPQDSTLYSFARTAYFRFRSVVK